MFLTNVILMAMNTFLMIVFRTKNNYLSNFLVVFLATSKSNTYPRLCINKQYITFI